MTIEKLKNGRYRIRVQINGKRYDRRLDHKPTKREAAMIEAELLGQSETDCNGTFEHYALRYIDDCRKANKSVTTIDGYGSILRNLPNWYKKLILREVTNIINQRMVDDYYNNGKRSRKTVSNASGFCASVITRYRPDFVYNVKIPTEHKKPSYKPNTADVLRILDMAEGTRYECALGLACLGMRRGEVCAITAKDLSDTNMLTINKSLALGEDNLYHIKHPKTEAGSRVIGPIPGSLAALIRENDCAFSGNPHTINETLHKYQDALLIPRFTLHTLRHFTAAYLRKQGFNDLQIMAWIGWETPATMKEVYLYNLDPEEANTEMAEKINSLFQ